MLKSNKSLLRHLSIPFVAEEAIYISDSLYFVDYCLTLPDGHVWLEVDGSSHHTPKSVYHTNPRYRGDLTAEQSFAKKVERDRIVDAWFKAQGLPLLRIAHRHFMVLVSERLAELVDAARSGVAIRTYKVMNMERHDMVADMLRHGCSTRDVGDAIGYSQESARAYIHQHKLNYLRQPKVPHVNTARLTVIEESLRAGVSTRELSRDLGMSHLYLRRYIRGNGMGFLLPPTKSFPGRDHTKLRVATRMLKEGYSVRDVGKAIGKTPARTKRYLQASGISDLARPGDNPVGHEKRNVR